MNRAIARRTAFESRRDIRVLLALVAGAVRRRQIEVHAFSILATHFHLLVRSLDGRLSDTMRRVENSYVRWFNRTRRRDGPLFRGRFRSFPVESARYACVLFRYIDQNAVEARLEQDPLRYPFGSAGSQSGSSRRRPWVCRSLVDRFIGSPSASGTDRTEAYRRVFPLRLTPALRRFVERRIAGVARGPDPLDDLVGASSASVRQWMERKARLADGTLPGIPLATPEAVTAVVEAHRRRSPDARISVGPRSERSLWDVVRIVLLRDVAGESLSMIGRRFGASATDVWRRYTEHQGAIGRDLEYAEVLTGLARQVIERDHATSTSVCLGPSS